LLDINNSKEAIKSLNSTVKTEKLSIQIETAEKYAKEMNETFESLKKSWENQSYLEVKNELTNSKETISNKTKNINSTLESINSNISAYNSLIANITKIRQTIIDFQKTKITETTANKFVSFNF
jgi:chaperonin cofactor prefoldin